MEKKGKVLFAILMIVFCAVQVVILVANYINSSESIGINPLIPQSLLGYIRNFTIFMAGVYLVIITLNIFYIVKKQYFIPVCSISVAGIFLLRFFIEDISQLFIPN